MSVLNGSLYTTCITRQVILMICVKVTSILLQLAHLTLLLASLLPLDSPLTSLLLPPPVGVAGDA